MIKVLIIDDEPLQRQGIVRMTPWTDFDAEVVGDTGSGMEGILLARRLRRARRMLRESDERIYTVAAACGYQDTRYFSKIFQKHMGIKPTEYRYEKNL